MILYPLATVESGGAGFLDDRLEMAPVHIAEHASKIAAGPEFIARRIGAPDFFKGCDLPAILARIGRAIFAALRFVAHNSGGGGSC